MMSFSGRQCSVSQGGKRSHETGWRRNRWWQYLTSGVLNKELAPHPHTGPLIKGSALAVVIFLSAGL